MFSGIKKSLLMVACVGLLTSSAPLTARNTPVMLGGIALAGASGLYAAVLGLGIYALGAMENGFEGWLTPEQKKNNKFFTATYGDIHKKSPNQPEREAQMDSMAKAIGATRAELDALSMPEYLKLFSKTKEFAQLRGAVKKVCALATLVSVAGIAIAVKGYKFA